MGEKNGSKAFDLEKEGRGKKILKIEIDKKVYEKIEKIKDDLKNFDEPMRFNLDGVIESAVKRAVKAARKEVDDLRKLKPL